MIEFVFFLLDDAAHLLVEIFDKQRILMMLLDGFLIDVGHLFFLLEDQVR